MTNWYGMLLPGATPRETINTVNAEVRNILMLPETRKGLSATGMVVEASSANQFAEFLKRESLKYERVIQAAGIKGTL
jgi:tripartite-type tricarboxylate transporter receptor subunit TctC